MLKNITRSCYINNPLSSPLQVLNWYFGRLLQRIGESKKNLIQDFCLRYFVIFVTVNTHVSLRNKNGLVAMRNEGPNNLVKALEIYAAKLAQLPKFPPASDAQGWVTWRAENLEKFYTCLFTIDGELCINTVPIYAQLLSFRRKADTLLTRICNLYQSYQ